VTSNTYYLGNYIYDDNSVKFFSHPEGYVQPLPTGEFEYVYNYTDHLGNVRLSYADSDGNGSIDASTEIITEKNYYPFGLEHRGYNSNVSPNVNSVAQKFKFNGTELEESLGLNLYEMDMRQYDPAIARWTSIDPVTHHSNSTYNAFDNNPVFWADPSGADAVAINGGVKYTGQEAINVFNYIRNKFTSGGNSESNQDQQEDPKVYLYSNNENAFKDVERLSFVKATGDDNVAQLMGFYPYQEISDEQVRGELANLIFTALTAGLGSSSRMYIASDIMDNGATSSIIAN
jgi:RHS repeat-associated protein